MTSIESQPAKSAEAEISRLLDLIDHLQYLADLVDDSRHANDASDTVESELFLITSVMEIAAQYADRQLQLARRL